MNQNFFKNYIKPKLKSLLLKLHYHKKSEKKDILICSVPRSGSTLLFDVIGVNAGIKSITEPFHKERKLLQHLNIEDLRWRYICLNEQEKVAFKSYFDFLLNLNYGNRSFTIQQHNWITDRTLIKTLRTTSLIKWLSEEFPFDIIYLIRHPLANALSRIRNRWDASEADFTAYYKCDSYDNILSDEFPSFIDKQIKEDNILDLQVIKWCLENTIALDEIKNLENVVLLTYEELTLESERVISYLSNEFQLEKKNEMLEIINKPSHSSNLSLKKTKDAISKGKKRYLIENWRGKVGKSEQESVAKILDIFGIDIYNAYDCYPNSRYTTFL